MIAWRQLYEVLDRRISALEDRLRIVALRLSGGTGAPTDAQYLVGAANGTLSGERVTTDTATVAWDYGTAGQAKANVPDDAISNAKLANMAEGTVKGRAAGAGAGDPTDLTASQVKTLLGMGTGTIDFTIGKNSGAISTGVKCDVRIPINCTITAARLLADQSGSIVIDIWKDSYANYPPTDADSITASAPPTISADTKSEDTTLTGWSTSLAAGDILRFNVDSCADIQRVQGQLVVTY